MKRLLLLSVSLFVFSYGFSQQDTTAVLNALVKMRTALVAKDSVSLKKLLHPSMRFGHSNGWVQTYTEVFRDMSSRFLVYEKMETLSTEIFIEGSYAHVKEKVMVEGKFDGKNFSASLFVLHLWVKTKKGWQLLSRQSAKLS